MDKFFFVIGYTSQWGRHDGSKHITEIIFCEDGKPLVLELQAIYRRDRCEDHATSQFCANYLDEFLIKLHPDGSQEKIRINVTRKFQEKVSKELCDLKEQEWQRECDSEEYDGWNDPNSYDPDDY